MAAATGFAAVVSTCLLLLCAGVSTNPRPIVRSERKRNADAHGLQMDRKGAAASLVAMDVEANQEPSASTDTKAGATKQGEATTKSETPATSTAKAGDQDAGDTPEMLEKKAVEAEQVAQKKEAEEKAKEKADEEKAMTCEEMTKCPDGSPGQFRVPSAAKSKDPSLCCDIKQRYLIEVFGQVPKQKADFFLGVEDSNTCTLKIGDITHYGKQTMSEKLCRKADNVLSRRLTNYGKASNADKSMGKLWKEKAKARRKEGSKKERFELMNERPAGCYFDKEENQLLFNPSGGVPDKITTGSSVPLCVRNKYWIPETKAATKELKPEIGAEAPVKELKPEIGAEAPASLLEAEPKNSGCIEGYEVVNDEKDCWNFAKTYNKVPQDNFDVGEMCEAGKPCVRGDFPAGCFQYKNERDELKVMFNENAGTGNSHGAASICKADRDLFLTQVEGIVGAGRKTVEDRKEEKEERKAEKEEKVAEKGKNVAENAAQEPAKKPAENAAETAAGKGAENPAEKVAEKAAETAA